jgi:hypothetical protein
VRTALVIAVPLGVFFTAAAWRISELLSPDAIGMALGMLLGVLAGVPTAALVIVSLRSTAQNNDGFIDAPAASDVAISNIRNGAQNNDGFIDAPAITHAADVTPYTHTFRRVAGLPALPDRQAQIQELRSYLAYLEAEEVR